MFFSDDSSIEAPHCCDVPFLEMNRRAILICLIAGMILGWILWLVTQALYMCCCKRSNNLSSLGKPATAAIVSSTSTLSYVDEEPVCCEEEIIEQDNINLDNGGEEDHYAYAQGPYVAEQNVEGVEEPFVSEEELVTSYPPSYYGEAIYPEIETIPGTNNVDAEMLVEEANSTSMMDKYYPSSSLSSSLLSAQSNSGRSNQRTLANTKSQNSPRVIKRTVQARPQSHKQTRQTQQMQQTQKTQPTMVRSGSASRLIRRIPSASTQKVSQNTALRTISRRPMKPITNK